MSMHWFKHSLFPKKMDQSYPGTVTRGEQCVLSCFFLVEFAFDFLQYVC